MSLKFWQEFILFLKVRCERACLLVRKRTFCTGRTVVGIKTLGGGSAAAMAPKARRRLAVHPKGALVLALVLALSILAGVEAQTTTAAPVAQAPVTTPVPTCPGTRLKDYLFGGAIGIACDSRPIYRPVTRTAVGRESSCQASQNLWSGSHTLCTLPAVGAPGHDGERTDTICSVPVHRSQHQASAYRNARLVSAVFLCECLALRGSGPSFHPATRGMRMAVTVTQSGGACIGRTSG
jgi:hypothetical protein